MEKKLLFAMFVVIGLTNLARSSKHLKAAGTETKMKRKSEDDDVQGHSGETKKLKNLNIFSESILDEFDTTGFCTSTQRGAGDSLLAEFDGEDATDTINSVADITAIRVEPNSMAEAMKIILELDEKVKQLEKENGDINKKAIDQEKVIAVKDDEVAVLKGTVNSFEDEMKVKNAKIARHEKVAVNMKKEIDSLREFKAVIEKNKRPSKELKEAEEKATNLVKKVG